VPIHNDAAKFIRTNFGANNQPLSTPAFRRQGLQQDQLNFKCYLVGGKKAYIQIIKKIDKKIKAFSEAI